LFYSALGINVLAHSLTMLTCTKLYGVAGLLVEVKAKRKEESRVVEAKEAFNDLDANDDNV